MNQTNEKKLAQECLDAILNLKMGSLAQLIKSLQEQFGAQQDLEQPEEGEAKVEEKKTFRIKIVELGTSTKIPCLRALQKIYTGLSLSEISNMYKVGDLNKEYINKEAADEDIKALEAIGNGFKVELSEVK